MTNLCGIKGCPLEAGHSGYCQDPSPSKKCVIRFVRRYDLAGEPWAIQTTSSDGRPMTLALMREEPVFEQAHEPRASNARFRVCDGTAGPFIDDTQRDASIRVTGHFANDAERKQYIEHIAALLKRPAPPPLSVGDEIEWRGHKGTVLDTGIVRIRLDGGNTHHLFAKDMKKSAPTKCAVQATPTIPDRNVVCDLLSLIGEAEGITVEQVAAWTDAECLQAEEWASAMHLRASDNDDVILPPMPACVVAALGEVVSHE